MYRIKNIKFTHNKFSNKGGTQLLKKLRSHTELRFLALSWNNIRDGFLKPSKFEKIVNQFYKFSERDKKVFNNFHIDQAFKNSKNGI